MFQRKLEHMFHNDNLSPSTLSHVRRETDRGPTGAAGAGGGGIRGAGVASATPDRECGTGAGRGVGRGIAGRGDDGALINTGLTLEDSLPQTRAAFTAERFDPAEVRAIADNSRAVAREVLDALEPRPIEAAEQYSPAWLRQAARRLAARLNPGGTQRRREPRRDQHDARLRAVQDSMAVFDGLRPAPRTQTAAVRLGEMSMQMCASNPQSMRRRREGIARQHGAAPKNARSLAAT